MNITRNKASWAMFLAVSEREFVLQRWHYFGLLCISMFCAAFSSVDGITSFFPIIFVVSILERSLQPVLAFHSSTYRLLMPYAEQYAFYHSVISLFTLSLVSSLIIFNNLATMFLGFLALVGAALYAGFAKRELDLGTSLGYAMICAMLALVIFFIWLAINDYVYLNMQFGNWLQQHFLIVSTALSFIILGLLWRLHWIASTKFEHNPALFEDSTGKDKYLKSYKTPQAQRDEISSTNILTLCLSPLMRCLNAVRPNTPTYKMLFPEELPKISSTLTLALSFSLLASIGIMIIHYDGQASGFISIAPRMSLVGLFVVYGALVNELLDKSKLIAYLRLQTAANNRLTYMKEVASAVMMRQLVILFITMAPIMLTGLILEPDLSGVSLLLSALLVGVSSFFYFIAYTLWCLRNPEVHKLSPFSLFISACALISNWLAIRQDQTNFVLMLVIGVVLYAVSLRRWKRYDIEWSQ
jgi:hypothetical protein